MPTVSGSLFHFPSYVKFFKLPKTLKTWFESLIKGTLNISYKNKHGPTCAELKRKLQWSY